MGAGPCCPRRAARLQWMRVDLLDRSAVAQALEDVNPQAVYHLAGSAHVAQSWRDIHGTFEGNVLATHHLFEGLRRLTDKPRVLVACSGHVYAPQPRPIREDDEVKPASPYATSKLAAEMLAEQAWREDGIPVIIARAFNHIGPRQDPSFVAPSIARQIALIEAGRLEPVLTMGNLEAKRDLTDVRDTVLAYAALLNRGEPGSHTTSVPAAASPLASSSMRSSHGRGNKCESNRIRHAFGRMIRPCSLATVAALPQRPGWTPASPSSRRSTISFITGEHRSRRWRIFGGL